MNTRSLSEEDKQKCVFDAGYKQINQGLLHRREVQIMLASELGEEDLPQKYGTPTICLLDQEGMSRLNSKFAFHVRVYDEAAVDVTKPDLLSDDYSSALNRCEEYLQEEKHYTLFPTSG
jgi:hypothetical protein